MSHRKVISLGSSYAITLPSNWIKDNNLEKGDSLRYHVQGDNSLLLTTGKVKKRDHELLLEIEEDQSLDSIHRELIAGFVNGYNIINLKSNTLFTEKQQIFFREISSHLFMIIVKANSSHMTLKTLIDAENTSIISSTERICKITKVMYSEVLLCLNRPNERLLGSIAALENDVDQLKLLLSRLIKLSMTDPTIASTQGLDYLDCMYYQILVNHIERVADHIFHLSMSISSLIKIGKTIPEDIREIFHSTADKVFTDYDNAVISFINKDPKSTDKIIDNEKVIISILDSVILPSENQSAEKKDICVYLVNISESIRKISHYAADIAEMTIDRAYKKN